MHPVLFELPWGTSINSYGTLILVGTLLSMPGLWWDVKNRGFAALDRTKFFLDLYLVLFACTVIGGRLLYVLTTPQRFLDDPFEIFTFAPTGFVFFGSLIGIILGLRWLAWRYERPYGEIIDMVTTWLAIPHLFGRLGCFLAGCCYGAPWTGPWAVCFPAQSVAYLDPAVPHAGETTVALHPTQLYEAVGLTALLIVLVTKRMRRGPEPVWRQTGRYALGYGALRFVIELVRGDPDRRFAFETRWPDLADALGLPADHVFLLSTSQLVGAIVAVAGAVALWKTARK